MTEVRAPRRVEILPGVFLDEITSLEQCDRIYDDLVAAIPSIEAQIEHAKADRATLDPAWLAKANHALRIKKLNLPRLQELRGRFARAEKARAHNDLLKLQHTGDRAILRIVKEIAPEVATRAWDLARDRHPELFDEAQCSKPFSLGLGAGVP